MGQPLPLGPSARSQLYPCRRPWHKPTQQLEKLGWSIRKHSICFANCYSCLRASPVNSGESQNSLWVGPSGHSAFSRALADLKNGQTEVLVLGALCPLGLKNPQYMAFPAIDKLVLLALSCHQEPGSGFPLSGWGGGGGGGVLRPCTQVSKRIIVGFGPFRSRGQVHERKG